MCCFQFNWNTMQFNKSEFLKIEWKKRCNNIGLFPCNKQIHPIVKMVSHISIVWKHLIFERKASACSYSYAFNMFNREYDCFIRRENNLLTQTVMYTRFFLHKSKWWQQTNSVRNFCSFFFWANVSWSIRKRFILIVIIHVSNRFVLFANCAL